MNSAILYFRGDGDGWAQVGSQNHLPDVQQNAASVMDGAVIRSFAIDIVGHHMEHCEFAIEDVTPLGCAFVDIGGTYTTPASANYVGAAAPTPCSWCGSRSSAERVVRASSSIPTTTVAASTARSARCWRATTT
ncbi:MAG: hypothetical protein IPK74_30690 [Deltaproteobacteria bacterium]|nr:hypothetical protein [Deltaproteobacteria bacterium]